MPRLLLLGGLCFWGPELLIYAWTRHETNAKIITFLLPGTLLVGYFLISFFRRARQACPSAAIYMSVGVWLLASTAMLLGATLQKAGFYTGVGSVAALLIGLLPPYALIMATYDGSLFALLLSLLMPLCHLIFERESWIIPPKWKLSVRQGR
ncbi:MAG TPA: hypothetical protein VGN39_10190 [Terriglobales bacterium]|nr:hypothetical protein [Terriglobales bacterium]